MINNVVLIVLNYNDWETTVEFLNNIANYDNIYRIVVVDNNSTDDSYKKLIKFKCEKIHVVQADENKGYSCGNNYGIKYSIRKFNPEYLIIANPDISFHNDIIDEMKRMYNIYNNVGIVAPKMKTKKSNVIAWRLPKLKDNIIVLLEILKKIYGDTTAYKDYELGDKHCFVEVLPGSFFMISSKTIKDINYFDEDTFLYCEENILCFKLKNKGYKNILINNKEYVHDHGISIEKSRFKNIIAKYKIYIKSIKIYNNKYLRIGFIYRIIFNFVAILCNIEKIFIYLIKLLNKV